MASAQRVRLRTRVADLWLCDTRALAADAPRLLATLAPWEHTDREHRRLGRGALRMVLARYLGGPPAEVDVRRRCPACGGRDHGPVRADGLHVSIAYTAGLVAIAVADRPVGVDVERIRPDLVWEPIARTVLGDGRIASLEAFYAAWTAREATGKARGTGLCGPPAGRHESADAGGLEGRERVRGEGLPGGVRGDGGEAAVARLVRWRWGASYVGALVM